MQDSLTPESVSRTPPDASLSDTTVWTASTKSLIFEFREPLKQISIEFTQYGAKPVDVEEFTFAIQFRDLPGSPEDPATEQVTHNSFKVLNRSKVQFAIMRKH